MAVLLADQLFAQSKKELQAEVQKLKAEVEQLKKPKEVDFNDRHKKASYGIGVLIGSNIKSQGGDSLDAESIAAGLSDIFLNKTLKLDQNEAGMFVQQYMQKAMEKKTSKAKEEGIAFLENNKKQEGITVTSSGLQYKKITDGKGKTPLATDKVTVHYVGKLIDGTVFDSSVERGEPATFAANEVIPGWTEALQLMKEGDKWTLFIPSDLAYGERGAPPQILPYATLIFDVELLKVN